MRRTGQTANVGLLKKMWSVPGEAMNVYLTRRLLSALIAFVGATLGSSCDCVQADDLRSSGSGLRVAVVQFDARPGEVAANLDAMERLVMEAVEHQAMLVMFHELATADYMDDMKQFAEPIPDGPSCRRMGDLARRLGCYISFGMPELNGEQLHIAQVFFSPTEFLYHYRKTWLCQMSSDDGYRDEWARYNPGAGPSLVYIDGIRATCFICADAESSRCIEQARALRPEIVFFPINRGAHTFQEYPERVARLGAVTLVPNRVGKSHTRNCAGGSVIYDKNGRVVRQANREFKEEILFYDVNFSK